jgi:hypothetical protein
MNSVQKISDGFFALLFIAFKFDDGFSVELDFPEQSTL